jgi:hypothetical protein
MFRPFYMAIFRLLREEVFYVQYNYITTIYVKHLLTQKPEDGHVNWSKHVAWSTINTSWKIAKVVDEIYSYIIIFMIIYNTSGMYCSNVKISNPRLTHL